MIALMSSLRGEAENHLAHAAIDFKKTISGFTFHTGVIDGTPVIIIARGKDHMDTARAIHVLVDNFKVEQVILTGTAASLVPYMQQGDIFGVERLVQYNPAWNNADSSVSRITMQGDILSLDADIIKDLAASYEAVHGSKSNRPQYLTGNMISGEVEISKREMVGQLIKEFGAVTSDLDGAAVAAVCASNNLPLAVIKSIVDEGVDLADPSPNVNGFDTLALIRHYLAGRAQSVQLIV